MDPFKEKFEISSIFTLSIEPRIGFLAKFSNEGEGERTTGL
jgi:hypothetical protein